MRELSHHIMDITRNSIDAGAHHIQVSVAEDPATDSLTITVTDDGVGMDPRVAERADDPFCTTRTTRKVGLGLSLLGAACERCGGSLQISSSPGSGTVVRAMMILSHVDRAPLGDLGAMVQAMACEAPLIRFTYRHEVAGRVFEVDTQGLQEELEDVPLTQPEVLVWLRDHVNLELDALRDAAARMV